MNITQIGSFPPPYGGQSVHIKNLRDFLISKGHQCLIFNTGSNKQTNDDRGVVHVHSGQDLVIKLLKNNSDLLHVHCGTAPTFRKVYICYIVSRLLRKKTVVTIHSGVFPRDLMRLSAITRTLFLKILGNYNIIIAVNENIRESLVEGGIRREAVRLIPAFSLNADFSKVNLSESVSRFFDKHYPLVSCAGLFKPQYGLNLALEAISKLRLEYPEIGMIVMSSGKGKNRFIEETRAKNCEENVMVLEDTPHNHCLLILGKSTLFLRPTLYDGDAISVREALAQRTPVVASNTDYRPEGTVLFEKGNALDLVRKIRECLIECPKRTNVPQQIVEEKNLEKILDCYLEAMPDKL